MKLSTLIKYTVIAVIIVDFIRIVSWVKGFSFSYGTYISAFLQYSSLLIIGNYATKHKLKTLIPKSIFILFQLWLIWNTFNIVRGGFMADGYWDRKFLFFSSVPFSLITLVFFIGSDFYQTLKIFSFYLKYIFTFGFLFIPLATVSDHELYSRIMIPISIFILFIPYLKQRWQILIVIVAITSIAVAIDFRTNILKITLSVVILSIFYLKQIIGQKLVRFIHLILFIAPLILLFLATTGSFNILEKMAKNEDYVITDEHGKDQSLTQDTRTFLYVEVLASMKNTKEWLIGKSASQGYNSIWFKDTGGAMNGIRHRSEVNILNILLYHGIIGVSIYFFLFYSISYIAINKSNNKLSKMLGLLIATRWLLSFIEEFTQYDLNFYFLWLIMGLVSTKIFRSMTDGELKNYLRLT